MPPRVVLAQVHLLEVLIEPALGEQMPPRLALVVQQRHLRQLGRMDQPRDTRQPALERRGRDGGARPGGPVEMQVRAAPAVPAAEQLPRGVGHAVDGHPLPFHHVLVEVGWPADGLAGVVDDEIEPVAGGQQLVAEGFDARRVAEIETEDLEPVAPVGEVRLHGVAGRRVAGESGGDDQPRAGPEELDPRLVADLDPPAGQQRHAAAEVGRLGALGEVELGARRTELVVEVVDVGELLLADVAVLGLDRLPEVGIAGLFALLEAAGRKNVGTGVDRLAAEGPDPGGVARLLLAAHPGGLALAHRGPDQPAAGEGVGRVDVAGRLDQAVPVVGGHAEEECAVGHDPFEQRGGGAQALEKLGVGGRARGAALRCGHGGGSLTTGRAEAQERPHPRKISATYRRGDPHHGLGMARSLCWPQYSMRGAAPGICRARLPA